MGLTFSAAPVQTAPNGTWLSQPQIWYYASRQSLNDVMAEIRGSDFKVVFLDVRKVSEAMQREAAQAARRQGLLPVVWVQSPQYRALGISDLVQQLPQLQLFWFLYHVSSLSKCLDFFYYFPLFYFVFCFRYIKFLT